MTAHHIDRAIEALARRQHGAFNRRQALDLGASSSFINRRLTNGSWLRLAAAVYALPGNAPTFERQCMAAVLSEPVAWISGAAAAVLHGLNGFRPGAIEITVPAAANHHNPFARVRRSDSFAGTTVAGISAGTVEQTICDLASRIDSARLEDVVDLALAQRRTTVQRLAGRYEDISPGARRRLGVLGGILDTRSQHAFAPPTSVLEAALYRVLDHPLLPDYRRQAAFPWRPHAPQRIDAVIDRWQLIPEADGRTWHTRVADFKRDRRRDRDALAHGYRVARYVYDELVSAPRAVLDDLLRIGDAPRSAG